MRPRRACIARGGPGMHLGSGSRPDIAPHQPEATPMPLALRSRALRALLGVTLLGITPLGAACGGEADQASGGADDRAAGAPAAAATSGDDAADGPVAFTEADLDAYERGLQAEIELVRAAQERSRTAGTPEARGEAM